MNKRLNCNEGISLIEALVSITILALMAMSLCRSTITAFRVHKMVGVNGAMQILAQDKIEQYAAINPQSMTSVSHDTTENNLTSTALSNNIKFTRVTDVTQNADASRTISVSVTCTHPMFNKTVTKMTTFTRW